MTMLEAPPPPNDVDEALNEEQLINIQIDAHSVKEVLSELSVRLESAHQQISTLQDKKEINDINERIDKLQDQIEMVATQSSRRANNAPQSMEEVTLEIKKHILPLKENFQEMLDQLHDSIKDENLKLLEEKLDLFRKENIEYLDKEYTSISQHNSVLAHIETLFDNVSDLSKIQHVVINKEVHSDDDKHPTIPDDFIEQLKLIQERIEILENKPNDMKPDLKFQKEFEEIKEKVEKQQEAIKECNGTLLLLGQKFTQYQNELEGRLNIIELSNLNTESSNKSESEQNQGNEDSQSKLLSKIIPIISSLQEKQLQLETKVQEQENLIQTLQKKSSSKPTVTFVIEETNSNQIIRNENDIDQEKIANPISNEQLSQKSSRDLISRSLENVSIESRSPTQIFSMQSTPRDHQSFKELSRHLNENDLRVTDLENEVILIKASLNDIGNNNSDQNVSKAETIAELKSALDQKHAEQSQLVLSSLSSSRLSNHQTSREQFESSRESLPSLLNDQNPLNNSNNNLCKENNIDDFSINDFGNLSKQVQSLLIRVGNLESRTPTRFVTPIDETLVDGEINNKSSKSFSAKSNSPFESGSQTPKTNQKHVQFSSTSVQTFEDAESQVAITLDISTSPAATTPNENNYQSILNINNDGHLDSSRIESEPESSENRPKKVELRISTPINEDISASRTPNSLTPNSGERSKQFLNDHYIALINKMSNSLNETIQTVASLSESVNNMNNKIESFISEHQNDNFNQEEFTNSMINQVRFEIEQRLVGLTPQVIQDLNNFASIGLVKSIAQNFQFSVDNIDTQIAQIKEFLNSLVTRNDLDAVLDKINNNNNININNHVGGGAPGIPDTAAGTYKMRCLLCGRAASGVTGMIAESEVARLLGTPPNSLPKKLPNRSSLDNNSSRMVLTFAKDPMKQKNAKKLKVAALPPIQDQVNLSNKAESNA